MPKYTDVKIIEYIEKPAFKNQSFENWAVSEYEYQVSTDPKTEAVERAYFSDKRSETPIQEELAGIVKMEHDLLGVLSDMEILGVYVDRDALRELGDELEAKSRLLLAEMRDLVGEDFNPLSAKQVQHILYDRMGISKGKKIKTGFSVDSETLAEIAKEYAIAGMILDYRGFEKLRGTYCE
jgi:DNA polymerase I-like protein with 3'-5' exonuclease and polymerase domains